MKLKEKESNKKLTFVTLFFVLLFFCNGCYQPIEGCLDPLSTNYNVLADNACEQCCTYPRVRIEMRHRLGADLYSLNDTLTNDLGERFLILDQKIYFGDLQLFTADNQQIPLQDSAGFFIIPDNLPFNVAHNFAMLRQTQQNLDFSTTPFAGQVAYIKVLIGLPDVFDSFNTETLPSLGSIINTSENMVFNDQLASAYWRVADLNRQDTINAYFMSDIPLNLGYGAPIQNLRGRPLTLPIRLQMDQLFMGIDWSNSQTWENAFIQNFSLALLAENWTFLQIFFVIVLKVTH